MGGWKGGRDLEKSFVGAMWSENPASAIRSKDLVGPCGGGTKVLNVANGCNSCCETPRATR